MTAQSFDPGPILDALLGVTGRQPKGGPQYSAVCPAHQDRNASLSFKANPDRGLVSCHAGCGTVDIMDALGLPVAALFPPRDPNARPTDRGPDDWMPCVGGLKGEPRNPDHRKVAEYEYRDADGRVVLGVARCAKKDFAQFRPDPTSKSGRRWSITLPDGTKAGAGIPYRLPELQRAIEQGVAVWIVEGEKDANRLASIGIPATCNAGGGTTSNDGKSKWTEAHAEWLAGADVIVVADRDATGERWATRVVETLMPLARSLEVVQAATGKDTSDHLDAGLRIGQFVRVAEPIPIPTAVPGCPDCTTEGDR